MNNTAHKDDGSAPLYERAWLKLLLSGSCLFVIVLMIWVVRGQASLPNGNVPVAAVTAAVAIAAYGWMLRRLYSLCSIVMSDDGVRQSFVLRNGKFREHLHLGWDQIQTVSFRDRSYHFHGVDGAKLELDTGLFNDAAATIRAVRALLPDRLLSQLS